MATWLHDLMAREPRRVVGLMSGTSADGIDAALVEISGSGPDTRVQTLAFQTIELSAALRDQVFGLFRVEARVDELCRLNVVLGEAFAAAALASISALLSSASDWMFVMKSG